MRKQVLLIHSAGSQQRGQGSAALLKHLRNDLGADYKVTCPPMPRPSKPSYEKWKLGLRTQLHAASESLILIGHSLGGSVLLKYLSEENFTIGAVGLFVVAAPYWGTEDWQVAEFELRKDFSKHLPLSLRMFLYQSRDDEVVPAAHLSLYARAIPKATVRMVDGQGHEFKNGLPELIEDIRRVSCDAHIDAPLSVTLAERLP